MSLTFINDSQNIGEQIKQYIKRSKVLDFLVGYFYFSGFKEIYENLEDKQVKILIGMDLEKDLKNVFKEVYNFKDNKGVSRKDIKDQFYESLRFFINENDYFDSIDNQKAFNLFIAKLENGSLEIRKTKNPTHAKMYIFEYKDDLKIEGSSEGAIIIGSSNLTYSGLRENNEINVITQDKTDYENAKKIFDKFWNESIPIVDKNTYEDFKTEVIEKTWINLIPSPYLLYIRVLHEYFETIKTKTEYLPSQITSDKFYDLKYQIDAIERAISIIQQHNGVIIADVVGLGKSIIASSVAHVLRLKTIVIAPPHLKSNWESYILEFDVPGKVISTGKLNEALDFIEHDDSEKLIIIDEAHKFRNERTQSYAILHQICQGNKVILLSATPFNNEPADILSLLKLFQIPNSPSINNSLNLQKEFNTFQSEFKKYKSEKNDEELKKLSQKIRDIIEPIVIRRTRLDLNNIEEYKKDLISQNVKFPKVEEPKLLNYDLGEMSDLYIETLEKIAPSTEQNDQKKIFNATRYKPVLYLKNREKYRKRLEDFFEMENFENAQGNIAEFMRKLLVFRFESSIYAFKKSLNNMIRTSEIMKKWYKFGKIPIYKKGNVVDPDEIFENDSYEDQLDDQEESLNALKEKGYFFIDSKEIKKGFIEDLENDIKILNNIYNQWFSKNKLVDKKLERFKEELKTLLTKKNRKIVVFSMYIDTIDYLYDKLKEEFEVFKYTSKTATSENKKILKEEFDATSNIKGNKYRILLATDAISEGFNLNRADIIFNYDIPYNPTRVIQRIGRINRIGKEVQEKIFIYNYFPSMIGENEVNTKKISTAKMTMFNYLFGSDTKTLTSEEELISYFWESYKKQEEEEESWDAKYLNDLNRIKNNENEKYQKALNMPKRVRTKIINSEKTGAVFFVKNENRYQFLRIEDSDISIFSAEEGLKLFYNMRNKDFEKTTEKLENYFKALDSNTVFHKKVEGKTIDKSEMELKNFLNVYMKNSNLVEKEYFKLLYDIVIQSALPKFFIKNALNIIKSNKNNVSLIYENLRKLLSEKYLRRINSRINKNIVGDTSVILIEQFD
jgi:SNF2 family DNA or RNA helicase